MTAYPTGGAHQGPPPNYLVQSILATIFCCLPLGIVAIVFAAQVNGKWQAGDHAGAMNASKQAKTWSMISIGIGVVVILIAIILNLAAGGLALQQQQQGG